MKTVDVEDFAQAVKSSLIRYLLKVVSGLPQVKPVIALPVIGPIFLKIVEWILSLAVGQAGLAAFIINTKVFTGAQARDYMDALDKINKAPDDISDAEWAKLEGKANEAFYRLVHFTS